MWNQGTPSQSQANLQQQSQQWQMWQQYNTQPGAAGQQWYGQQGQQQMQPYMQYPGQVMNPAQQAAGGNIQQVWPGQQTWQYPAQFTAGTMPTPTPGPAVAPASAPPLPPLPSEPAPPLPDEPPAPLPPGPPPDVPVASSANEPSGTAGAVLSATASSAVISAAPVSAIVSASPSLTSSTAQASAVSQEPVHGVPPAASSASAPAAAQMPYFTGQAQFPGTSPAYGASSQSLPQPSYQQPPQQYQQHAPGHLQPLEQQQPRQYPQQQQHQQQQQQQQQQQLQQQQSWPVDKGPQALGHRQYSAYQSGNLTHQKPGDTQGGINPSSQPKSLLSTPPGGVPGHPVQPKTHVGPPGPGGPPPYPADRQPRALMSTVGRSEPPTSLVSGHSPHSAITDVSRAPAPGHYGGSPSRNKTGQQLLHVDQPASNPKGSPRRSDDSGPVAATAMSERPDKTGSSVRPGWSSGSWKAEPKASEPPWPENKTAAVDWSTVAAGDKPQWPSNGAEPPWPQREDSVWKEVVFGDNRGSSSDHAARPKPPTLADASLGDKEGSKWRDWSDDRHHPHVDERPETRERDYAAEAESQRGSRWDSSDYAHGNRSYDSNRPRERCPVDSGHDVNDRQRRYDEERPYPEPHVATEFQHPEEARRHDPDTSRGDYDYSHEASQGDYHAPVSKHSEDRGREKPQREKDLFLDSHEQAAPERVSRFEYSRDEPRTAVHDYHHSPTYAGAPRERDSALGSRDREATEPDVLPSHESQSSSDWRSAWHTSEPSSDSRHHDQGSQGYTEEHSDWRAHSHHQPPADGYTRPEPAAMDLEAESEHDARDRSRHTYEQRHGPAQYDNPGTGHQGWTAEPGQGRFGDESWSGGGYGSFPAQQPGYNSQYGSWPQQQHGGNEQSYGAYSADGYGPTGTGQHAAPTGTLSNLDILQAAGIGQAPAKPKGALPSWLRSSLEKVLAKKKETDTEKDAEDPETSDDERSASEAVVEEQQRTPSPPPKVLKAPSKSAYPSDARIRELNARNEVSGAESVPDEDDSGADEGLSVQERMRRMMTEVLLNSTDEEVYSVCKEAVSDALLVRQRVMSQAAPDVLRLLGYSSDSDSDDGKSAGAPPVAKQRQVLTDGYGVPVMNQPAESRSPSPPLPAQLHGEPDPDLDGMAMDGEPLDAGPMDESHMGPPHSGMPDDEYANPSGKMSHTGVSYQHVAPPAGEADLSSGHYQHEPSIRESTGDVGRSQDRDYDDRHHHHSASRHRRDRDYSPHARNGSRSPRRHHRSKHRHRSSSPSSRSRKHHRRDRDERSRSRSPSRRHNHSSSRHR